MTGVPTTILDPRQGWDIGKAVKLLMSGQYHSTPAFMRHVDFPLEDCQQRGPLFPKHERVFLHPTLWVGDSYIYIYMIPERGPQTKFGATH